MIVDIRPSTALKNEGRCRKFDPVIRYEICCSVIIDCDSDGCVIVDDHLNKSLPDEDVLITVIDIFT